MSASTKAKEATVMIAKRNIEDKLSYKSGVSAIFY